MKKYESANIRNLCVIGPKGAGKTTFLESLLYVSKAIGRMGTIEQGNTALDIDPLEIERTQTLSSKYVPIEWKDYKVNCLDTPGYADFWGETVGALAASDIAVLVVESGIGADIATGRLLGYVDKLGLPKVFIINKMDSDRANWEEAFKSIKEKVSSAVLFQLPLGQGSSFKGVVDLLDMKAYTFEGEKTLVGEVPEDIKAKATEYRTALIESAAENDEKLLEKYLDGKELTEEEIRGALHFGIKQGAFAPVFLTAADKAVGSEPFLNTVINHFPAPTELLAPPAKDKDGNNITVKVDPAGKFAAQVFKVTSDPGIGDIFFFRVWAGSIKSGDDVYNSTKNSNERVGHLLIIRGKQREEVDVINTGDIIAVAKLKDTGIHDTLCVKSDSVQFDPIPFPEPVVPLAVIPITKKDQDRLGVSLAKIMATDLTLKYHVDKEFAETIVTGMGEIHIEMMVKKLKEKYQVDIELGKPHIPYREAITKKSEKQGKHKKQSGGHGQFGDCWLRLEPLSSGSGFEFISEIFGGSIPSKYVPAVEKGVREAMRRGVLAGYPVVDFKATVYDGSYHDVDSSDLAFQIAATSAFKGAMEAARPQLLEPIVDLEVYSPQDFMGDLSSDISSRRGRVSGMGSGVINAKVPLAELYQYSASLKSITSGAGTYTMTFSHYEAVPAHISQKVIDATKKEKEEAKK